MATERVSAPESDEQETPLTALMAIPRDRRAEVFEALRGGFTAEMLDEIPDLPPHTELIDGSLVLVSPQARFHMKMLRILEFALCRAVPGGWRIEREMTVIFGPRQRPEPDFVLVPDDAPMNETETAYGAADVALVIEVVSPESEERDRERKPDLYARAEIPHFWRVENEDGKAAVHVYEYDDTTRAYVATGVHRERLKVSVPFPVDIDLTEIERM